MWKHIESDNYIFNFLEGSTAEKEINEIIKIQEGCFKHIKNTLKVDFNGKIQYYFCQTPEKVGVLYGDNEPCNGFAESPNKVYAVYNEKTKCIGFHEDAHILSYIINKPNSAAIREGLAMFYDKKWHGISNLDWTAFYIFENKYISIVEMLNDKNFFNIDCNISYPIIGAFTEYLILSYGMDNYKKFYSHSNLLKGFYEGFGLDIWQLESDFNEYINLFEKNHELFSLLKNN